MGLLFIFQHNQKLIKFKGGFDHRLGRSEGSVLAVLKISNKKHNQMAT